MSRYSKKEKISMRKILYNQIIYFIIIFIIQFTFILSQTNIFVFDSQEFRHGIFEI